MKLFSRNKRERTYNMKTYKVGLIRVLTTEDEELLQLHGKLIESYFPMFQVVSRCIPDQPGSSGGKTGRTDSGYRSGIQYCSVESVFWQSSGCVGDYRRCTVRISADIR